MILFSRNQTYRREHLTDLLESDRALFENWTHDASIIPTEFYPFWQRRFQRDREGLLKRWRDWRREGFEELLATVLTHVGDSDGVMSRHFGGQKPKNSDGWWDWHPSKTALEFLWRTGELAVARRDGFQKVYDLAERVIPSEHRIHYPDHEEFVDWCCRNALARLGIATASEIAAFWAGVTTTEAKTWCEARLGNDLVEVEVESADGTKPKLAFVYEPVERLMQDLAPAPQRLRVLSPFDPLLRDRARALRLFNFDYRIEVFVPEAKRLYGYYVFPLLEGDRLIGRIDMKHLRQQGVLHVSALWLEAGIKFVVNRQQKLDAELERLRKFVGASAVTFSPGYVKSM